MSEVMDTTEVADAAAQTEGSGLDVVNETITYAITRSPAKEGSEKPGELGFSVLKEGNATDKAIAEGKIELLHKVDVTIPFANTLAGIQQLVPDEEELVTIFGKGAMSKVTTRVRAYFTEVNDAGELLHTDEPTYDATSDLSEPMKRRAMSDTQKAVKVLKGISAEALAEALKALGIIA